MNRSVQFINKKDIEIARKLLNNYLTELSEYIPTIKFDKNGIPVYKWFDYYWTERSRFPLFLKIEGQTAGFALIRELADNSYEVSEFYILPNYRRDGNGMWFANQIAALFGGKLEFSAAHKNTVAVKFWTKFFSQFCDDKKVWDDDLWKYFEVRINKQTQTTKTIKTE